jgi:hypothetical protein
MRNADKLTWLTGCGFLCISLYLVSYHPLRAVQYRFPALNRPVVDAAFTPARRVAESPTLERPMRYWARVWGQETRCRPSLRSLGLALHNYMDGCGTLLAASNNNDSLGPGQFPPID